MRFQQIYRPFNLVFETLTWWLTSAPEFKVLENVLTLPKN